MNFPGMPPCCFYSGLSSAHVPIALPGRRDAEVFVCFRLVLGCFALLGKVFSILVIVDIKLRRHQPLKYSPAPVLLSALLAVAFHT
ncbi:hypothetical protein BDV32DRAFT_33794 [Aspergillus pseudonomiae]|nr:hypothetical protein BDV32DRAFT_33794 [Aspergillus pseudonomiae]